jgi:syntaxin-binding protein 1
LYILLPIPFLTLVFDQPYSGRSAATADDSDYAACRYTPPLKSIVEDLLNGELSMEEYPSVLPMPDQGNSGGAKGIVKSVRGTSRRGEAASARKSKGASSSWAKSSSASGSRGGGGVHFTGGRSIVFTVGGMSYSELRTCREVTMNEQREIVVGSTAFISPRDFLSDLGELGRED